MVTCSCCFAESTAAHHTRIVHNHVELHGPWLGWRKAKNAPRQGAQVKVVIADLADWQARHFGRMAG